MYPAANSKHASPSGAELLPENRIPLTKGHSPTRDAKALLEGRLSDPSLTVRERIAEFSKFPPETSIADLEAVFPSWPGDDEFSRRYNALSPVERAIDDLLINFLDENPINADGKHRLRYHHEILQGQRRALLTLLALAEPDRFGPIEALLRRQEEELRSALPPMTTKPSWGRCHRSTEQRDALSAIKNIEARPRRFRIRRQPSKITCQLMPKRRWFL